MKFQEEGTWCVLYDRTEGERLVAVLRKYFSDAANESYGICVWRGGRGGVDVGVCDEPTWLRKEINIWSWQRNWPGDWNLRAVYREIFCFIKLDYEVYSSAWRVKKAISSISHEYSVLLQGLPVKIYHHHHHIYFIELSHLLTRSGLTYPEVSSKVYHDSFCQLGRSISLPWVIYCEAFYLHVVSSFSCIPVICPDLVFF